MPRSNSMNGGIIGKDNTPSPSKKVTTFTSNGCFTRTATTATVITIAGGGGASRGGGGAGGVLITECHPLPASTVPVTVGAGGAASAQHGCRASDGSNSVFGSATPLTATAGGAGGGITQPGQSKGGDGGSGGGGGGDNPAESGAGTAGQGFDGGSGFATGGSGNGGGGGAARQGGSGNNASPGGRGKDLTPYGVPTCLGECGFFGGGGAGSGDCHPSNPYQTPGQPGPRTPVHSGAPEATTKNVGEGGLGGGGMSSVGFPLPDFRPTSGSTAGLANTGGGGGGGHYMSPNGSPPYTANTTGQNGGSGVVIVIESAPGSSANSGIYSLQAQYRDTSRSSW